MHVPDGFISPKMYVPAYAVAATVWTIALARVRRTLDAEIVPLLGVVTAGTFMLMLIAVPLPGGATAHATGVALLAVTFGVWMSFLSVSMVLVLQALLLGTGGITSLPINALAIGLVGGALASWSFHSLRRANQTLALFVAGWLSVMVSSAIVAVALGLQPSIAHRADGTPLFFPFGLSITLPAVLLPHALVGIGEGILTVIAFRFVERLRGVKR